MFIDIAILQDTSFESEKTLNILFDLYLVFRQKLSKNYNKSYKWTLKTKHFKEVQSKVYSLKESM